MYDPAQRLDLFLNADLVVATAPSRDSLDELRVLLERHARYTGSARATALLDAWERESRLFVHVAPSTETTTVDTDAELVAEGAA